MDSSVLSHTVHLGQESDEVETNDSICVIEPLFGHELIQNISIKDMEIDTNGSVDSEGNLTCEIEVSDSSDSTPTLDCTQDISLNSVENRLQEAGYTKAEIESGISAQNSTDSSDYGWDRPLIFSNREMFSRMKNWKFLERF